MQDRLKVVFYKDLADLSGLEKAWAELASSRDEPHYFQSQAWVRHVTGIRSDQPADRWRMCLATVWHGERLSAIWPLSLQREGLCWIARSLDDPFGQFTSLLADDGEDPKDLVDMIVEALKSEGLAAGMMIERVPEGSRLHKALAARNGNVLYSDRSVFLDFRPFDSFEAYLKTRKTKTRKNLRNAKNRLMRDHGFEHDILSGADDIRSIMDQAFETRLVWMQDNAKTAPAFRDPDFRRLLDGLAEGQTRDDLIGFRLRSGDTPISVQWGFVHAGRYYAFISARNPDFDAYSPGRVHLGMVLEACHSLGIEVVELMAPASDYKMNWTDQIKRIDDFGLPLTAGGFLYLDLWRRHGRTIARKLYHGLPDGLRRHISALTNKT